MGRLVEEFGEHTAKLFAFYKKHFRERLENNDATLLKYKGHEEEHLRRLEEQARTQRI